MARNGFRAVDRGQSLLLSTGLLLSMTAAAAMAQENPPTVLFDLNFDQGFAAVTPSGPASPTNTNLPKLVPGLKGQAARMDSGTVLRYLSANRMNRAAGALSLWVRTPVDGVGVKDQRYTLFRDDGVNGRATGTYWLWAFGGRGLRMDVRDPGDHYTYFGTMDQWSKGQWHHLAINWDHQQGITVYQDGQVISHGPDGGVMFTWPVKTFEAFFIGADNLQGEKAWLGEIDELKIFDRPITLEQAQTEYARFGQATPPQVIATARYFTAGQNEICPLVIRQSIARPVTLKDVRWTLSQERGAWQTSGKWGDLSPDATGLIRTSLTAACPTPGHYRLELRYQTDAGPQAARLNLTALSKESDSMPTSVSQTLVQEIDLSQVAPLTESSPSRVVASPMGTYRQLGDQRFDRLAVAIDVKELDQPHRLVVTVPDDRARTMEFSLQNLDNDDDWQTQSGLFLGAEYPNSQKMIRHEMIFWPSSANQRLIVMTAEKGRPAAVQKVEVYRLSGQAKMAVKPFVGSVPARSLGYYFEDPILWMALGTSREPEAFSKAVDRLTGYLDSFAQDSLCYPVSWYSGNLYGQSLSDPMPNPDNIEGRPHPLDYPRLLMRKLAQHGMGFNAALHTHSLARLRPFVGNDPARVSAESDTAANMQANGQIKTTGWHGSDPLYNPLDARVQQIVREQVQEILDRYGDEPNLTGITLNMARVKLFTFGSIESGYNDSNLAAFQRETGVAIPDYRPGDADRIVKSARWLLANARQPWIDWRCRKLAGHYRSLAAMVAARRPDLTLTLDLFFDPKFTHRLVDGYRQQPDLMLQIIKETGIDPALYADIANLRLAYTLVPADLRWRGFEQAPAANIENYRTLYTAPEILSPLQSLAIQRTVILHDRYFESDIGKRSPLPHYASQPGHRERTWRASTLNPTGANALEGYVMALDRLDALSIHRGGYVVGTYGIEPPIARFAQAYRALPSVDFQDVPGLADPVRVRQRVVDGRCYVYLLNTLPYSAQVTIKRVSSATGSDLVSGQSWSTGDDSLTLGLSAYELKAWVFDVAKPAIISGSAQAAESLVQQLRRQVQQAQAKFASARQQGKDVTAIAASLTLAQRCVNEGRWSRLYYLMQEAWTANLDRLASGN